MLVWIPDSSGFWHILARFARFQVVTWQVVGVVTMLGKNPTAPCVPLPAPQVWRHRWHPSSWPQEKRASASWRNGFVFTFKMEQKGRIIHDNTMIQCMIILQFASGFGALLFSTQAFRPCRCSESNLFDTSSMICLGCSKELRCHTAGWCPQLIVNGR